MSRYERDKYNRASEKQMAGSSDAANDDMERAELYEQLERIVADKELSVTGPAVLRMLATLVVVNAENRKDDPLILCEEFFIPQLLAAIRGLMERKAAGVM